MPAPAAERLGAHTALVDKWEVGRIVPIISSNIEAIALTFRGEFSYGRKLRVYEKLLSALSFLVKSVSRFHSLSELWVHGRGSYKITV